MSETTTSGLERVSFGRLGRDAVDEWLASVTRDRLGADVAQIRFRAGRIDAVYALRLQDGEQVLLKLRRPPVDLVALEASIKALRYLSSAGYPAHGRSSGQSSATGGL